MRINNSTPASNLNKSSVSKGKKTSAKGRARDSVQVSDAAGLRERAKVMLADMPEVRLDKIEDIRNALENDTYTMNSKTVSTYIVRNALSEHPWG